MSNFRELKKTLKRPEGLLFLNVFPQFFLCCVQWNCFNLRIRESRSWFSVLSFSAPEGCIGCLMLA
ncbi:unnamed protein product, partial [Linum tenue]